MISQRLSPPLPPEALPRTSSNSASLGLLSGWTQCQWSLCPPDRTVGGRRIGRCVFVPRCEEKVALGPARKPKVSTGILSYWTPASHDLDAAYESQISVARIRATTYGSQTNVGEPGPPEPNPPEPEEPKPTQASVCVSPHETQPIFVFTAARLASHYLTSFLRLLVLLSVPRRCCCCCCSLLFLLPPEEAPISQRPAVGAPSHTAYSRASPSHYTLLLLDRAKEGLPRSPHTLQTRPLITNSHVATAIQWPSTIVLDASCTHAPTSSPHSRPNTLVAPRCCPPVSPCLSSVAAARLAASLH